MTRLISSKWSVGYQQWSATGERELFDKIYQNLIVFNYMTVFLKKMLGLNIVLML